MYNLTIINLDTTRSRVLLPDTTSKLVVINKMQSYLKRLGLNDNSVIALQRDDSHYTMFYHPVIKAFCVIRLKRV